MHSECVTRANTTTSSRVISTRSSSHAFQLLVAPNAGLPCWRQNGFPHGSLTLLSAYVLSSTQLVVVGKAKHIKTSINYFIGKLKLPGISSVYPLRAGTLNGRRQLGEAMIPDGLELLKNMNDISDVATCNISQFIKASAKFFMFKDLENIRLPGGPPCDAF